MKIKFVKQDVWAGIYWKHTPPPDVYHKDSPLSDIWKTTFYLCIIPCFPIIWERFWHKHQHKDEKSRGTRCRELSMMKRIAMWLVWNAPLGRLAPWVFGFVIGRRPRK